VTLPTTHIKAPHGSSKQKKLSLREYRYIIDLFRTNVMYFFYADDKTGSLTLKKGHEFSQSEKSTQENIWVYHNNSGIRKLYILYSSPATASGITAWWIGGV
jgi:hypothetical protein